MLGAGVLALVSDWDVWVSRRVDSFCFNGDDERVLARHQSIDFKLPDLARKFEPLTKALGGIPVPVTFMNKWRLPQFSLRDESDHTVSLLARPKSVPIAAGMLIALGNWTFTGELLPDAPRLMPPKTRDLLLEIVASDPARAMQLCAELSHSSVDAGWRAELAANKVFMGLAYELARGFIVLALYPKRTTGRRVLKLSYSSYVVPATRDQMPVRVRHILRRIGRRRWDVRDSISWRRKPRVGPRSSGRIVLSTVCDPVAERMRAGGLNLACALVSVKGPDGIRQTMRLRPNSAVALEHVPKGRYTVEIEARSGFEVDSPGDFCFQLAEGSSRRIEIQAKQKKVSERATLAVSMLGQPATMMRSITRGLGWHSKPLVIRVRLGDGGSYHCELEAPAGLHVTRARLVSNTKTDGDESSRELDRALYSAQRAELYACARETQPATAYAVFDLRPRIETLVRPTMLTAWVAFAALLIVALGWRTHTGFDKHGPTDSSALLVLLLAAPTALVAYFSQTVQSRVTYAVLYGLRLFALLPALLALLAGAVLLVGEHRPWAHWALWSLDFLSLMVVSFLSLTWWWVGHPREQRATERAQGQELEQRFLSTPQAGVIGGAANVVASETEQSQPGSSITQEIRDEMLERADGLSRVTRRMLLGQPGLIRKDFKVPPALYFDSAETPPTFIGLVTRSHREDIRKEVHDLMRKPQQRINRLERSLSGRQRIVDRIRVRERV